MPGKIITSTFLNNTKENIHRVLDNYYGIPCAHYRRTSDNRDLYYDNTQDDFEILGVHLIHLSQQDFDTLKNDTVHFEATLPIEVFLDPKSDWEEHDEVLVEIDLEDTLYSSRQEIIRVRSSNHAGVTLYKMGDLAPVRVSR